jgi:lipopolysaccharide biosynthesis regulator YciM
MRFWTALKILVFAAALGFVAHHIHINDALLMRPFRIMGGREIPLLAVITAALVFGLMLSVVLLGLREFDSFLARSEVKKTVRQQSQADSLSYAGINLMLEGRHAEAEKTFRQALALQPSHGRAALRLGQVLRLQGRPKDALEEHRRLAERYAAKPGAPANPIPWSLRSETAQDLRALQRYDEAVKTVHKGLADNPERRDEAERLLLQVFMDAHDWKRAEDVFESLRKRAGAKAEGFAGAEFEYVLPYRKALDLARRGEEKAARKILTGLVKRHPKFAPSYVELGRLYASAEREESAIEVWLRGLRATSSLVFLPLLEEYFLSSGRPDRALQVFRGIVRESRSEILPRFLLGKLYYRLEMVDEAYEEFRSIEARVAHSPTLHYFMGKVRERRGALGEAVENYKKAMRESGLLALQYACRSCRASQAGWDDHCPVCGAWGSLELDLRTELRDETRSIADAPVYSASA